MYILNRHISNINPIRNYCLGLVFVLFFVGNGWAQSKKTQKAAPNFIGSAGNTAVSNSVTYMWSVGENIVFTGTNINGFFTQGFHQPMICKTTPFISASNQTSCLLPYTLSVTSAFHAYYWKLGTSSIVNGTSNVYNPVTNGNYKVFVGDSTGCMLTSSSVNVDLSTKNIIPVITAFGNGVKDTLLQSSVASSYQWYTITPTDGVHRAIVGANKQAYNPLYNGTYYVKINTDENCVSYSTYYVINNTNWDAITRYATILSDSTIQIDNFSFNYKANVYPIPAFDKVNIDYETPNKHAITLSIYDIKGTLVDSRKMPVINGKVNYIFSKNELSSGNYILNLVDGDHKEVHSIIFE